MKNNKFHLLKVSSVVIALGTMVSTFGFACSAGFQGMQIAEQSSFDLGGGGGTGGLPDNPPADPTVRTVGVPILSQTYASLAGALQLPTVSNAIRNEYNNQFQNLSDSGRPNTVGSPLLLAISGLGGQACLDRITFEQNANNPKLFFNAINLGAAPNNNVNEANLTITINRLARALWQRNETAAERQILITAVNESMALDTANNATETREAMLFLCTAMASSIAGISL